MTRAHLPGPAAGQRIGLLGGSFNPAHDGHRHVAETALKRLRLDGVWWIVARGNPLKSEHGSFDERLASAAIAARGPGMHVTDIERQLDLTYTVDTLRVLQATEPAARFVWLMGADSAASFHLWKDWEEIAARVPIAVISRPGTRVSRALPFVRRFADARLPERDARTLPGHAAPAWVYLRAPGNAQSSTRLRAAR
ncbi:MAG: nicotinate-nucleotide adenylyltransferase [Hyphomonas sp.]|uniref:nicotinate-nucleotide adenylyltransferase n=1 Tax=Hyphomonas sp. TaxID=87 RepID=UPI0034A062C0